MDGNSVGGGGMKRVTIRNETTIPTAKIRDIVNFVAPSGKWHCELRVAWGKHPHGLAGGRAIVWIARRYRYPTTFGVGGGYLGVRCFSQEETLVYITAHELRHIQRGQMKVRVLRPYGGRRNGRAGREGDADMFALRKLRAWRRRGMAEPGVRLPSCRTVAPTLPRSTSTPREASLRMALNRATAGQARAIRRMKRAITAAKRAHTAFQRFKRCANRAEKSLSAVQ
jgi:hypothetical protein